MYKKRENDLISDIKLIEENENLMQITDLLDDKKSELQKLEIVIERGIL